MTYQLSASYCARYNQSKPPLPYFLGQEFRIHPHTPPSPATGEVVLSYEGHRERETTHPVDRCILHPPLPGLTGKGTIRLKVVGHVRIGDQHSAQLVTVHLVDKTLDISDSIPTDKYLVAKLYDPLYFDHEQDDVDPFRYTDLAYSHETAAYRLLYPLEGTVIPRYYGSFTLELPIPNKRISRSIRLILIEKVPGISMQHLNPTNYTRSERQDILKAIVDAESMLYAHDILHRDIHPRNVLVLDSALRRVVLIDFGYCGIGRTPSNSPAEWKAKHLPGVPISPLLRWDQGWGRHANFHEWIDWDWQTWLEHCYEFTRASITEHMRSIWLPKVPRISTPPRSSASSVCFPAPLPFSSS
ncbi:PKc-like superfamily domain-containing protein [Histoplasma ohiense]|nr:PKc-like superfamily domain-containing protein [Histoplasma ohiense (nom. inval.)]